MHHFEKYQTVKPTEKEYGQTLYRCKHCGMIKSDNYVEPTSYLMHNVVINEVCGANDSFLPDENGDCFDWIELYNSTDRTINSLGFGLSDKKTDLFKYTFEDVQIKLNGYLVVYVVAYEVIESFDSNEIYANFKLTSKVESIYLTLPTGKIIDRITYLKLKGNAFTNNKQHKQGTNI